MPEIKAAQITCPICDSADIQHQVQKRLIGDELTGSMEIDEHIYRCLNCGEDGDFGGQNDAIYKAAIAELYQHATAKILADLAAQGSSNAHVERTLGLPQRTLARWKKDGASASAVTLLKFVATYPWLMEVAEQKYDSTFSKQILVRQAAEILTVTMAMTNFTTYVSEQTESNYSIRISNLPSQTSSSAADEQLALAA